MTQYSLLDACDTLKVVKSCDVHTFRQFVEIQRLDKNRRMASYPAKGAALKGRLAGKKVDAITASLARAAELAKLLHDHGYPFEYIYDLAAHEHGQGLPLRGRRSLTLAKRLSFLQSKERQNVSSRVPGGKVHSPGGSIRNPFEALKAALTRMPLTPMPANVDAPDRVTWAVGVDYSQEWCVLGYGRGRLIRSIPLTPGESIEIVAKTWNKRTDRRQDVQATENDVSTEFVGDEKWSLATRKETTASLNGGVNGNVQQHADVSVPVEVVEVGAGGSAGLGGNLNGSITQTVGETSERIQQETIKAANRLKTTVSSTVETVAEAGREVTQTQRISNPNRCNSVAYHFFEVVENYRVRTGPTAVAPYLLVPLDRPTISFEWLLCHECELKSLLPCETYYQGFAAAKTLQARAQLGEFLGTFDTPEISAGADALVDIVSQLLSVYHRLSSASLAVGATDGGVLGPVGDALTALAAFAADPAKAANEVEDQIVKTGEDIVNTLVDTGGQVLGAVAGFLGIQARRTFAGGRGAAALSDGTQAGGPGSFIYWEILKAAAPELNAALSALAERAAGVQALTVGPEKTRAAFGALNDFFTQVGDVQGAFDKVNRAVAVFAFTATLGVVLASLATLGLLAAALATLASLAALGFAAIAEGADAADLMPDDEGLQSLIMRAQGQMQHLSGLALLPPPPGTDATKESLARYDRALQELKRERLEAANARVEFERVKCHLEENFEYYNQQLWLNKSASVVQARLQAFNIPLHAVDQRIAGFVRNRAAFRVNADFLTGDFDWQKEVARLKLDKLLVAPPAEFELSMPTQGMVVEPVLGTCNGCDDFVMQHRDLDLLARAAEVKLLEAQAEQAQLEVKRYDARIQAGELSDPTPFERADRIEVAVNAESSPTTTVAP